MSKVIKIGIVFFVLLFFISISNIYALSMDIDNFTQTSGNLTQDNIQPTTNETNTNIVNSDGSLNGSSGLTDNEDSTQGSDETLVPTPNNNQSSLPESNLGLTNILNILLIVVGFVLILLAVAIMLRLRR